MKDSTGIGLYVHIPFCRAKCTYCGFNSYAGLEPLFDDYVSALALELEQAGVQRGKTIYIGGGTPTVLPLSLLARLLSAIYRSLAVESGAEVSVEANPGTVDSNTLSGLCALGVNRLSLGVQSFEDDELRLLGRIHSAAEAREAFYAARRAGLDNVSLDLLYGVPGQSLTSWQVSLERALDLQPEHLSLYCLTIEEGTVLATALEQQELDAIDPDLAADMYELAQGLLAEAGFVHYEISNWARRPELQCQHNLTYWRNEPYRGIGAGAHSWCDGRRWGNSLRPADYVRQVCNGEQPIAEEETIDQEMEMAETMILGLRLLDEGVAFERFVQRFGLDLRQRFASELDELLKLGLIESDGQRVRLSERGRLLGNQVFFRFLPG